MASSVTLSALGLNYSPNLLSLPDGSLTVAKDVIIRRDNVIESRRGIREYSEGIGLSSDIPKQLIEYKNRLLVHSSNKISFDTTILNSSDKSIFDDFSGTFLETQDGLRIKSIEANKNLYFTTADGIKKISARTAADFTTTANYIVDAGAIKAIDLSAELDITQGQVDGFLPNDSAVAYRYLFGYKDVNNNLILGTPSDRVIVYNYLSDVIGMDINGLAVILDVIDQTGSMIDDGNYASLFYTPLNTDPSVLRTNVIELAKKLDLDILYASGNGAGAPLDMGNIDLTSNIVTITFTTGLPESYFSVGDSIELSGFSGTFTPVNGNHTIVSVDDATFTITFSLIGTNITLAAVNSGALIYSNSYRNITATGDDLFTQDLDTLLITSPATSEELRIIHNNIFRIIERLKVELVGVISSTLQTDYVTPFVLTESANVLLNITIPTNLPDYYFVQVYRTRIFTAEGVQTLGGTGGIPINPDDEMRLVFEQFPTPAEITAGELIFLDNYPEELVQNNTNLYTNPVTGDGILQANDLPPFAKDINRFKNVIFYANTRTRHRLNPFQLLGVANITSGDTITISNGLVSDTYTFIDGVQEVTPVTCTLTGLAAGEYFIAYSANDDTKYYFWYEIDGTGTAPVVVDGVTVKIPFASAVTTTNTLLAERTRDVINTLVLDFSVTSVTNTITITNAQFGKTTDATAGTTPFTIGSITQGNGEDAALKQVLLSTAVSAAQAIDETARSLVRVINKQSSILVNAYYVSSENSPPGQINLEAKNLDDVPFYVLASNALIGASFNPDIGPIYTTITGVSIANPTVITATAHGLLNMEQIMIAGTNTTPSVNGLWTITRIDANTFSIPVNVTAVTDVTGVWSEIGDLAVSDNEVKPNRIYYSKVNQPEAVPILNFFDVGPEDKPILRIFPLRDSLFVFKQDGLYRVSGESAPFVEGLFDSSCVLLAPDSVSVTNNEIYCWTDAGISKVTETGVSEISRPIDTEILRLASSTFTNFSKITWGVGYDSDNSYTVYTNTETDDGVATIAFRYSNLTNTWTNVIRTQSCGIINDADDKLYMGSGNKNLIEQERKDFTRKDYADRDFVVQLSINNLFSEGKVLKFSSVDDIEVGDVVTQEQLVSIYDFNKLLTQLELDPTVGINTITSTSGASTTITVTVSTAHNLANNDYINIQDSNSDPIIDGLYQVSNVTAFTFDITVAAALTTQATLGKSKRAYSTMFQAEKGNLLRDNLELLAQKLDTDPGIVTSNFFDRIDTKTGSITSNSVSSPTVVTTSAIHELINGRIITISGTQTPASIPTIVGTHTISGTGTFGVSSTFTIPVNVTSSGGTGLTYATAQNENSFPDIQASYNEIVNILNNDAGPTFNNYKLVTETKLLEAVVLSVNRVLRQVTLNLPLQWVVGPMSVYKSIPCEFVYSPQTFDDPLMLKQIYEATVMFHSKAFTKVTVEFSSDLKPAFTPVDFFGQGNGIFGHYSDPGFGYGFFGGASNAAPFRTIVPRDSQRCRFLNVKIKHSVARELWSLYGITLTGNVQQSTRAYR